MISLELLKQALSGVLPPAEAERVARELAAAIESSIQAEVERRVALLETRSRQVLEELRVRVEAALELAQEGLRIAVENTQALRELRALVEAQDERLARLEVIVAENTRAIQELRAIVEQHSLQIAENTRAIQELRAIVEQHSLQIAENTRAIQELRAIVEQHSLQIAENTRAIQELRAIVEQHSLQIAENTRAIQELREVVGELAQAEKRLTQRTDDLARQLGGLAMTVGYILENAAYPALPELLQQDYQIRVLSDLKRDFVEDERGNEYEVNIFGIGERDGQRLIIVGESKVQLSKPDIDRFLRRKLKPLQRIFAGQMLFPVLVTHMTTSKKVLAYAQEKGIAVYLSYQFRRSAGLL